MAAAVRPPTAARFNPVVAGVGLVAAVMVVVFASATAAVAATPDPARAALDPPSSVRAKPGVGSVIISWQQLPSSGVTYVVSSSPAGKGCQVVDGASCTIPVTDSTPWRFSVTASDGSGSSAPSPLTAVLRHRLLLVLAGQSNAVGAESYAVDPISGVNYLAPPYTNEADAVSKVAWWQWWLLPARTTRPVSLDTPQLRRFETPPSQIFGPEIGLARQIWIDTGQPVTIVKAGYSNSSLAVDWDPGTPGGLYQQMVAKVVATMSTDAQAGQFDTIAGVYWYQGESDAMETGHYQVYQANLANFIASLRSDLPMDITTPIALAKESLAAVIALKQAFGACPPDNCADIQAGDDAVRAADDWAVDNLAHVVEVDTLGLPRSSILVHLANVGELSVGSQLATATDQLFPRAPDAPSVVSVVATVGKISVAYAAPGYNGGLPITGYQAKCGSSDGGLTRSSAYGVADPLVVSALSAGHTYTCTVVAKNAAGVSAASAPSVPVIV